MILNNLFLDVVFGKNIASNTSSNILNMIPQNFFFYFFLIFCFIILLVVIFYLIVPLFRDNPDKLYKKYIGIRTKLEKIDKLHDEKKISFETYVSSQFYYAKEYERIVKVLIKYPFYKDKIKSYKFKDNSQEEINKVVEKNKLEAQNIKLINTLYNKLLLKAKYFKKEEIIQAILDENLSKNIANSVVELLEQKGVKFNTSVIDPKENKVSSFLNTLFTKTTKVPLKEGPNIMVLDELKYKTQKEVDSGDKLDTSNIIEDEEIKKILPPKKKSVWKSFVSIFNSKDEKEHTVSEINDIFKDIEKELNRK